MKEFLASVVEDMERQMPTANFKSDPLVQKCSVLQEKLAGLIANLTKTEAPSTEKKFVQRETLMARANSLKKAISSVMDVTEKGTLKILATKFSTVLLLAGVLFSSNSA